SFDTSSGHPPKKNDSRNARVDFLRASDNFAYIRVRLERRQGQAAGSGRSQRQASQRDGAGVLRKARKFPITPLFVHWAADPKDYFRIAQDPGAIQKWDALVGDELYTQVTNPIAADDGRVRSNVYGEPWSLTARAAVDRDLAGG